MAKTLVCLRASFDDWQADPMHRRDDGVWELDRMVSECVGVAVCERGSSITSSVRKLTCQVDCCVCLRGGGSGSVRQVYVCVSSR